MTSAFDKISIIPLPRDLDSGVGRLAYPRGEMAVIVDGDREFTHLKAIAAKAGSDSSAHHHARKTEHSCLVSGRARIRTLDLDTGERREFPVSSGDIVTIRPRLCHTWRAETDLVIIEYCREKYDPSDTIACEIPDAPPLPAAPGP